MDVESKFFPRIGKDIMQLFLFVIAELMDIGKPCKFVALFIVGFRWSNCFLSETSILPSAGFFLLYQQLT
ncbi:MAG: hypothetical protein ACI93R_003388 [Flavobacteriales bacterium]|jgi:hypothetical protein